MESLVNRLRALTGAGTAEYTIGALSFWTDNNLQDTLDSNGQYLQSTPLDWQPTTIGGGTIAYYNAALGIRDCEEASSGTARWIIRDSVGAEIGTANYTVDYRAGRVLFSVDQTGSAYYLTAYTYDIYAAAADLWQERLANFTTWYDFRSDNQTLSRSQVWDHAEKMVLQMKQKSGANITQGELHTGLFYRTDMGA